MTVALQMRSMLPLPGMKGVAEVRGGDAAVHAGSSYESTCPASPCLALGIGENRLKAGSHTARVCCTCSPHGRRLRAMLAPEWQTSIKCLSSSLALKSSFISSPFGSCNTTTTMQMPTKKRIGGRKGEGSDDAAISPLKVRHVPTAQVSLTSEAASHISSSSSGSKSLESVERRVFESVVQHAATVGAQARYSWTSSPTVADNSTFPRSTDELLKIAYERCGEICAEYAKTFYLGTKLMTPERQRAIWAIYVWCRRTDELVDGPHASRITPGALDRWEGRLDDIFAGKPYDMLDAALSDTVARFPVDIQPFRDMIDGMRMDLTKNRYKTFDELYLYCYNVAGTVGVMSTPVMGIDKESQASTESVYSAALALGIANQLTNILRDVGEDAQRGRIYLPLDELDQFGLQESDIFAGKVTPKWREFMKFQLRRARQYFQDAEDGATQLSKESRWPVWASLIIYRQILDAIEANDYDNFSKRAYVTKFQKLVCLPSAYLLAQRSPKWKTTIPSLK